MIGLIMMLILVTPEVIKNTIYKVDVKVSNFL